MAPILRILSCLFATVSIGFGINAILQPASALSFFELDYPTLSKDRTLIDALLLVYAIRDIYMGVAGYIAAVYGSRRTLGLLNLAVGAVAWGDGYICKNIVGKGEWNHWGYAPVLAVLGLVILGT